MGKHRDSTTAVLASAGWLTPLSAWYERQKRVLPWRDEPTVYRVWVSEVMLQQTQVTTVIPYFERFVKRFPSVEALAGSSEEDVLRHWAGLGYYSRGRNLRNGAQRIVALGRFPATREEWLEIPGVGEYTAGAILSISGNSVEAILDGNVERVLSRVRAVGRERGDAAYKARLWRLARLSVTRANSVGILPSVWNQALMELGATICSPRNARCEVCPLASVCRARMTDEVEAFPPKKKPKQWVEVREELHCVLDFEGRVLLRKREKGEWRAGLWDLLDRAPDLSGLKKLGEVESRHIVTRHRITRVTQVWRAKNLTAAEGGISTLRWVSRENLEVPAGSALKRTLQKIREEWMEK